MDRAQFMKQLERLLSDISEAERDEALAYYNSYFDEAGASNEAEVIRELGSPGKVAAIIKADLRESSEEYAQYTEHGYEDSREEKDVQVPETFGKKRRTGYHPKGSGSGISRILLLIIALVFLSPFLTGAFGGIVGVLVTVLLIPFVVILAAGAVALGVTIGAIACLFAGIYYLFTSTGIGILALGMGCLFLAAGILAWKLTIWLGARILPWILQKVTDFFHRILYRNKEA